jgi:hypothetical protein
MISIVKRLMSGPPRSTTVTVGQRQGAATWQCAARSPRCRCWTGRARSSDLLRAVPDEAGVHRADMVHRRQGTPPGTTAGRGRRRVWCRRWAWATRRPTDASGPRRCVQAHTGSRRWQRAQRRSVCGSHRSTAAVGIATACSSVGLTRLHRALRGLGRCGCGSVDGAGLPALVAPPQQPEESRQRPAAPGHAGAPQQQRLPADPVGGRRRRRHRGLGRHGQRRSGPAERCV